MHRCPDCGQIRTRIVHTPGNLLRLIGSLLIAPVYLLGGGAGTDRGPILPLERRCPRCGARFMYRSILDDLLGSRRGVRLSDDEDAEGGSPRA